MNEQTEDGREGEAARAGGSGPGIDTELLRRVCEGDDGASAAFLAAVQDRAWRMVLDALRGPPDRRSPALERLIRAYRRDPLQIQAALLSAQTSFRRHLLGLVQAEEIRDDRDYVTALITLTYNRWQRRHYRDTQACVQSVVGSSGDEDLATTWLSRAADPRPGPDHRPIVEDFYAKLVEEIHLMSKDLRPGEPEVVFLRLFEEMTYEQIGRKVGKSTASVGRICQKVVDHLRRRFRDSAP